MPIKVRVGQTDAIKILSSAGGGSVSAVTAQNVIGGIASVTQLSVSGISTLSGGLILTGGLSIDNLVVSGITTSSSFVGPLTGDVVGDLTGDVTGDVTGNVTGNVVGNLTGNVTGIADTALSLSGTPNIGVGIITAASINSTGNLDVDGHTELDDVNVSGAITATTFTGNLAGLVNTASQPNITLLGTLTNLNVNGHSELDNVNVSGVSTFVGVVTTTNDLFVGGDLFVSDDIVLDSLRGNSLNITGLSTFVGNAQFNGNVSIAGTLTYEDVTNIDSVGVVTARSGVRINSGGLVVSSGVATFTSAIDANGGANISGGLVANSLQVSDLTSGRVVLAGASGELEDSTNLTFNGSLFTVTGNHTVTGTLTAGLIDGGSF